MTGEGKSNGWKRSHTYTEVNAPRSVDLGHKHGDAAFRRYAAHKWNPLPTEVKSVPSVIFFKIQSKNCTRANKKLWLALFFKMPIAVEDEDTTAQQTHSKALCAAKWPSMDHKRRHCAPRKPQPRQ